MGNNVKAAEQQAENTGKEMENKQLAITTEKIPLREATITGPIGIDIPCFIDPVDKFWFSTEQCSDLLQYAQPNQVRKLYSAHKHEFSKIHTGEKRFSVESTRNSKGGRPSRFFSLEGLILLITHPATPQWCCRSYLQKTWDYYLTYSHD